MTKDSSSARRLRDLQRAFEAAARALALCADDDHHIRYHTHQGHPPPLDRHTPSPPPARRVHQHPERRAQRADTRDASTQTNSQGAHQPPLPANPAAANGRIFAYDKWGHRTSGADTLEPIRLVDPIQVDLKSIMIDDPEPDDPEPSKPAKARVPAPSRLYARRADGDPRREYIKLKPCAPTGCKQRQICMRCEQEILNPREKRMARPSWKY